MKLAVISGLLAVMFITAPALALGIINKHRTQAYLVNGSARYAGEYTPVFDCVFPFVFLSKEENENGYLPYGSYGLFSISIPDSKTIGWNFEESDSSEKVVDSGTLQGTRKFKIIRHGSEHDSFGIATENGDVSGNLGFTTNAEEIIPDPESTYSVEVDGKEIKKSVFTSFLSTEDQIAAKCVPYMELITSGGNITGLKWRFVNPDNPTVALTRGKDSNITSVWDFSVWSKNNDRLQRGDLEFQPQNGDPLEGTVFFQRSRPIDDADRVSIRFVYDIAPDADLGVDDVTDSYYEWKFTLKNDENYGPLIDVENGWNLRTGIEVVEKHKELEGVTDSNGNASTSEVAKLDAVDETTIVSMPVFEVSVASGGRTAIMSYSCMLNDIAEKKYNVEDLTLVKLTKNGPVEFTRVADPKDVENGKFAVTETLGYKPLNPKDDVKSRVEYTFKFGIEDNGDYDWDDNEGNIVDPAAVAAKLKSDNDNQNGNSNNNNTDNSGGGGCNAGFGMSGLLFAGLAVLRHRKI
jgi:hypothetical protein